MVLLQDDSKIEVTYSTSFNYNCGSGTFVAIYFISQFSKTFHRIFTAYKFFLNFSVGGAYVGQVIEKKLNDGSGQ